MAEDNAPEPAAFVPPIQQPIWRDLFTFTTWRHAAFLATGLSAAVLAGALKTTMSILLGRIFGVIAQYGAGDLPGPETLAEVSSWCVLLTLVGGAGWLINFAVLFSWVTFGELQARSVRSSLFRGLLEKEMAWFDSQPDGVASLLVRVHTQTRELQIATSIALGNLTVEVATALANLIVALYTAWKLTLVLLASLPLSILILNFLTRQLKPAILTQRRELSKASKYANAAISAIDLVKVFNGIDHETWQYLSAIRRSMLQYLIQARSNAYQFCYVKFWIESLFVVGFYYGAVLVDQGLSPANVLTAFYAALNALQALEAFVPMYLVLAKGMAAGQTLRSVSKKSERGRSVHPMMGGLVPGKCIGDIEFHNVTFAYPSNLSNVVLRESSFHFRHGGLYFIVGRSGSGKSTLGNLLLNFYEPLSGDIFIDGNSIRTLDINWLRKNITLVQQSSVLFNDSFFMNVAVGHPNPTCVSTMRVKAACEMSLLQPTISSLPAGLHTYIGTAGHSLSGGEKQRLALARAKLRDTPVLILDEITSGLDPASRALMMEAIRRWRKGKTTIIITHEVAQLEQGDFVYVMDNGFVVQEGLFGDLEQQAGGLLAQLMASATTMPPRDDHETGGNRNRTRTRSTVVNFSRLLSDASQNNALVPGSPSPGEGPRGTQWSSSDGLLTSAAFQPLRTFGSVRHYRTDATSFLHTLAMAEEAPKRGRVSRAIASLSQQLTSTQASSHQPSSARDTCDKASSQLSPIKTKSIMMLQELGKKIQFNRCVPDHDQTQHLSQTANSDGSKRKQHAPVNSTTTSVVVNKKGHATDTMSLIAIYRTVWPCLRFKERFFTIIGLVMNLIVAGSVPAFSIVFANLLSALYNQEDRLRSGRKWALALLIIAMSGAVATFLGHYLLEWAGQAWVNALRSQAFHRVLRQPKAWFDNPKHSPSRINECLDRNAEEMKNLVGRFAPLFLVVVIMILASVIWAMVISWKLTLISLASGPFLIAATKGYSAVSNQWETRCDKAIDATNSIVTETLANIRVIRALTLERYFTKKHETSTQQVFRLGIKKAAYTAVMYACWQSMFWFLMALIFWYATVLLAINQEITVHTILQVVNLLVLGLSTASNIMNSIPGISASKMTAGRLLYFANLPLQSSHEIKGTKKAMRLLPIDMNKLSFTYPLKHNRPVLRNLSLSFTAGSLTTIVGSSGCGKSTIASLILGLYIPDPPSRSTPSGGFIHPLTFASIPIQQLDTNSLRNHIGYVPQTPFLFPASVAANITYGLPEESPLRSQVNVEQAAREAGIHDFIRSLPDGYDTMVGDGGQALSGGQTQRVCIARALAKRPTVLVLDEPTSALDAQSAEGIRKTIQGLLYESEQRNSHKCQEKLCIIMITHSKEMMRIADTIVVIDDGHVAETGPYTELISSRGKFYELVSGETGTGIIRDTTPAKQKTRARGELKTPRNNDLPLRLDSTQELRSRRQWVGAREVDWTPNTGPSTAIQSPYIAVSPLSMPKKRKEHKVDDE
ncbi:P-loop containing nucleoside triphosphate hydrolase protein [Xylariaceae sp. FL1272]|nr:P-loop containing nucleoside triphosphate hydrolase protein [Xylariaceae sp. FL1272]